MTVSKSASSVAIAIALAAGLVSCSSTSSGADVRATSPGRSPFDGPVPEFKGPWAAEFANAYRSASSDVIRKILERESITDQDYAIASGMFVKCMANKGFAIEVDGPAGEMTILDTPTQADTDRAFAASNICDTGWSALCALRHSLLRNPENLDENTIMVACLEKEKLVPPSYTAKDYGRDDLAMKFPFNTSSAGYDRCIRNPLGLGSTG